MSRRRRAEKREVLPDPKFGDRVVSKFMNNVMRDGKKSVAERIVYGAFDEIESRGGSDAVKVFHEAIDNVKRPLRRATIVPRVVQDTIANAVGTNEMVRKRITVDRQRKLASQAVLVHDHRQFRQPQGFVSDIGEVVGQELLDAMVDRTANFF